ncbi:NAD(P)/FAD-dependent oxidoreductase [Actinoplanes sp. CA-142083]|uniref:NAD(P)/FAD-dependent oxidoreductase n=1 Tax=Actinoplanes sp. CA-142083 TaxID=3239903 RepID=UPI003D8A43F0
MRRIVIAGNGISGLTAADTLRANGFDGDLTLIGDEPHPAYSRPALSKALLRDEAGLTAHQLPPPTHGAAERLGVRVAALDDERRLVVLDDGDRVLYDGLVVATGCRARRLGPPDSGELTLRGLDDALRLRRRIADRPAVLVVGGGPLGMEIASSCLAAGCGVTLVSRGMPLAAQLGSHFSALFTAAARERGLRIVETKEARIDSPGTVILAGGHRLEADLIVTAAGDLPNVEWLGMSGALEVDGRLRFRPGIVAAGDVAAIPTAQGFRRVPLWSSAIDQGKVAAAALLYGDAAAPLDPRPYFWTEQFGISLKVAGPLPAIGPPTPLDGDGLLRWERPAGPATVAAVNYRIPIPRLRKLSAGAVLS